MMQGQLCATHRACPLTPGRWQSLRSPHLVRQGEQQRQRYGGHRARPGRTICAAASERLKPAYNKYRSRNDIQQSYIREWQKTTARDGNIKPQTILSTLWFVPIWLKYQAVPDILRYAWYMVWVHIVAAYRKYHTWAVLQGAQLDVYLAKKSSHPMATFSRSLVMQRYHHDVSLRENLSYRWKLYKAAFSGAEAAFTWEGVLPLQSSHMSWPQLEGSQLLQWHIPDAIAAHSKNHAASEHICLRYAPGLQDYSIGSPTFGPVEAVLMRTRQPVESC